MIVVTTPNGNIGKHVLRQLIERGDSVRVISHNPDRIPADLRAKCEVVAGSLDDAGTLQKGFAGTESVFWCIPQSHSWNDADDYYSSFTQAATRAVATLGTDAPRLVTISSGGYGVGNAGAVSALHRMEDTLNATGVPVRHLRCGFFLENILWSLPSIKDQGAIVQPISADIRLPFVCTSDIGTKAVSLLTDGTWRDQKPVAVHGPEDLSHEEVCAVLSEVLEKPVRFVPIPWEAAKENLIKVGASPGFTNAYCDMFRAFGGGAYSREPRSAETTTPTTLREWATANLL